MSKIVYPVYEQPDHEEEYTAIVDATGRALDTSEVVQELSTQRKSILREVSAAYALAPDKSDFEKWLNAEWDKV